MSLKCGTRTTEPIMSELEKVPSLSPALFLADKLHSSARLCVCVARQLYNEKCEEKERDIQNEE